MKQGEIRLANLDPTKGREQTGFRPVLIISGNLLNLHLEIVLICPLTTKLKYYKGNPILQPSPENGLKSPSEVLIFHIRSVSKSRLIEKLGYTDPSVIKESHRTINDILRY